MSYRYHGGKLKRWNELSFKDQAALLHDLLYAFSLIKNTRESALFLTDLLTSDEVKFLSKRLRIAKLLLDGWNYAEIRRCLKVSPSTIAKVSAWLKDRGEGFRNIIKRIPQNKAISKQTNVSAFFWPGRIFEEAERSAINSKNLETGQVLKFLEEKKTLRNQIDREYRDNLKERRKIKKP